MPVYKYFGHPAKYGGRPLMHLLCNLKGLGRGRVVSRLSEEAGASKAPSFYRILWAQPLMDSESKEGRVVAEKVKEGVRYVEPVDISSIASMPDFRLVPKAEEEKFCRWSELRDFCPSVDKVVEPKYFSAPPLLQLLEPSGEEVLLPHFKTFRAKDREVVRLPGEAREREVLHQETVTECEGTASYSYSSVVAQGTAWPTSPELLAQLPEEPPYPKPVVGMRLHKPIFDDLFKRAKEEVRTEEHDTFFP